MSMRKAILRNGLTGSIAPGHSFSRQYQVQARHCISAIDASLPTTMGTYALVELIEVVCASSVLDHLAEGTVSVAESLQITHKKAVGLGAELSVCSTVIQVDRENIDFTATAFAHGREVANCIHRRRIIDRRILERAAKLRGKAQIE
jgi:predicted thioesterase